MPKLPELHHHCDLEMKTFYEKRLIDQAEPRLVYDQFADYYPVPQNGGKTIEFRKYDSLPKPPLR